jgi:mono/diheme cytochrome c family protein
VTWDTTTVGDGPVELTATATDTSGNVGTSAPVTVTVSNASTPSVTLSQLQAEVFTPRCSGCHDGSAPPTGALPGSMDLRAGNTHASLVDVASQQQPALLRVAPGDPEGSYLVHKLEGRAGIGGSRMPLGGPFLDAATLDAVRAWIEAGAAND